MNHSISYTNIMQAQKLSEPIFTDMKRCQAKLLGPESRFVKQCLKYVLYYCLKIRIIFTHKISNYEMRLSVNDGIMGNYFLSCFLFM